MAALLICREHFIKVIRVGRLKNASYTASWAFTRKNIYPLAHCAANVLLIKIVSGEINQ
ncbi:MAG: hypothetical protein JWO06_1127 [Bacteroidota bacterium]|nr:hypothetical protein [Bacteroidota bacterium]